ncbi:MAG TPA: FeoC-like transcriptional regulator [Terriglobia bacterium]|nr:FeoC-like transcriptional regulator [Terriglobia bacterium]
MPKPFSDDLRCRILGAYVRKEGSQRELARRFETSFEYVRKIVKQWRRNGKMERVPQRRRGAVSRITAEVKDKLRGWLKEQPDLTLAELGERLLAIGVRVSRSRVSQVLQQMGLRLKKSRFTPKNGIRRPTASGGRSFLPLSPRSRRKS